LLIFCEYQFFHLGLNHIIALHGFFLVVFLLSWFAPAVSGARCALNRQGPSTLAHTVPV
jgi:hypothetical protein